MAAILNFAPAGQNAYRVLYRPPQKMGGCFRQPPLHYILYFFALGGDFYQALCDEFVGGHCAQIVAL
ncbi:MAG: hypothetical protein J6Q92_06775, partial [Oscillospiraceae bacterium]|nr:hypothetical protein [Oscillospiraceae bacterium]